MTVTNVVVIIISSVTILFNLKMLFEMGAFPMIDRIIDRVNDYKHQKYMDSLPKVTEEEYQKMWADYRRENGLE